MYYAIYFILTFLRAGSLFLGKKKEIGALQTPVKFGWKQPVD